MLPWAAVGKLLHRLPDTSFCCCNKGGLGHEAIKRPAEILVSLGEAKSNMSHTHTVSSCSVGVGHWHTPSLNLCLVLPSPETTELAPEWSLSVN